MMVKTLYLYQLSLTNLIKNVASNVAVGKYNNIAFKVKWKRILVNISEDVTQRFDAATLTITNETLVDRHHNTHTHKL